MASYVLIDFDRTKPEIELFTPRYTTTEIVNVITLKANEPLSTYQEFYAKDHLGNRYDYTFHQEEPNLYVGRIRFAEFEHGLVNLYARVKDEVDNLSDEIVATIEIKEKIHILDMTISDKVREVDISDKARGTVVSSQSRSAKMGNRAPAIRMDESVKTVKDSVVEIEEEENGGTQ